jgi:hypothetical protein
MVYDVISTFLVGFYVTIVQPTFIALYNAVLPQELFTGFAWFDGFLLTVFGGAFMLVFVVLDKAGVFQPNSDEHIITWWSIPQSLGVRSYYVFAFIAVSLAYCAIVWWF